MGYHLNARYGAAGNAPGRLWRGLVAVILSFALFLQGAIPVQAALFGSFGVKDEKELGRKFDVLVRSRMPLVEDPEIKGYIQSIVDRLSKTFPPQPFPFTANVLLHNSMNAFAVPGGSVFVHTGLIMQLDHESELAGVLGHELAHVTQRHIATRMERAQAVTIGSLVGALAAALLGGGQGSGAIFAGSVAAGQAAMLNYSRMDEPEADHCVCRCDCRADQNRSFFVISNCFGCIQDLTTTDTDHDITAFFIHNVYQTVNLILTAFSVEILIYRCDLVSFKSSI